MSVDDVFRRPASRENLRAMVRGLLSDVPRKNMGQVAEAAGHALLDRLPDFLARAAWDADELRDRVREFVVDSLQAEDAVLIADETGDIKKGTKSAGVDRQYTGVTRQVENAQVSVHLSYGSSRGRAIIDRELYAGQHWAGRGEEHRRRCEEASIPQERARAVVTKPEPARRMVERALEAGVPFSYFLADELYGGSRALRAWLKRTPGPLRDGDPEERGAAAGRRPCPSGAAAVSEASRDTDGAPQLRGRGQGTARLRLRRRRPGRYPSRPGTDPVDPPLHRAEQEEQQR